jgi:hypothetical protein
MASSDPGGGSQPPPFGFDFLPPSFLDWATSGLNALAVKKTEMVLKKNATLYSEKAAKNLAPSATGAVTTTSTAKNSNISDINRFRVPEVPKFGAKSTPSAAGASGKYNPAVPKKVWPPRIPHDLSKHPNFPILTGMSLPDQVRASKRYWKTLKRRRPESDGARSC